MKLFSELQDYPNLFPDYNASLEAQQMLAKERGKVIPAADFLDILVIFIVSVEMGKSDNNHY